ncbi:MAG: hypothetical protein JXX28_00225 [Deltaproteobacteria bacterium]|nr:hypothetical protein [Deltaproteobacteria bacterium]
MAWWWFLSVAAATPSPPRPVLEVVGADCGPPALAAGAPLEVTWQRQALACSPGGPCERIEDTALSARELELWPVGCGALLSGRFERTSRSCEGHQVWRWRGALPPGRIEVRDYPDTVAILEVSGDPVRCADTPALSDWREVDLVDERSVLPLPLSALSVRALGEGRWEVSLDPREAGVALLGAAVLRAEVTGAARAEHVLAGLPLDGSGRAEASLVRRSWVDERDRLSRRHQECERVQHHRLTLAVGALSFTGEAEGAPVIARRPCEVPR